VRNVSFEGPESFFQETMLVYVEKTWVQWLGPLVPGLPSFETVIGELRPQIVSHLVAEVIRGFSSELPEHQEPKTDVKRQGTPRFPMAVRSMVE